MNVTSDTKKDWFCFENGVFPVKVFFYIGKRREMFKTAVDGMRLCFDNPSAMPNAESVACQLKDNFDPDCLGIDGECLSVVDDSGARVWFVRMDSFDGSIDATVMLSHECLHVATTILRHCGVDENAPFETLCYLHEAIYKCFMFDAFNRIGLLFTNKEAQEATRKTRSRK